MPRTQTPKGSGCTGCLRYAEKRCTASDKLNSNNTDILLVGDQPDSASAGGNDPFVGHGGGIIKRAVKVLRDSIDYRLITCAYTYAVQCTGEENAPPTKVLLQCQPFLTSTIGVHKPKVIVALGATAAKQLGFRQKHKDLRGRVVRHPRYSSPVIVTFSEKALLANPGLFDAFKLDLRNAFNVALKDGKTEQQSLEVLAARYEIPTDIDDAIRVCNEILQYSAPGKDPSVWPISVDTETNTLHPEKEGAAIIAFCFGWDKGKSTTIICDHPGASPEYRARLPELWEAIRRLLESPKPKIFHNAKFDLKFIELRYGIKVNGVAWDTLLGEHLLDEDKKGNYGLKALTAAYMPAYCGYEDKLHDLLSSGESVSVVDALEQEIANVDSALKGEYPEYIQALNAYKTEYVQYEDALVEFETAKRQHELALDDYYFLRNYHAGRVAVWQLDKKAFAKPKKTFTKPVLAVKAPKKPVRPEDPRSKKEKQISQDAGFEKVPLVDLQTYGAVDADVTRQLCLIQKRRILQEQSQVVGLMRTHAIPGSRVLGRMEYEGTRVDLKYIDVLDDALSKIVNETESELYAMAGTTRPNGTALNLNHAGTLADVLFNWGWLHPNGTRMMPYDAVERTKGGQYSTAEKALRAFVEYEDKEKTQPTLQSYFIERLLKYRKASKAHGTFLANVRALSKRDGFLHTQFHLNGTGTGRLSSSDMNMQNVPKYLAGWNIKKLFIPDDDSYFIANIDYKGAEVRVFTAYARDASLIKALNEGLDMHCFFAAKVFSRPYEDYANRDNSSYIPDAAMRKLLDKERSNIKRVVFGILYGAGRNKIAETIGVTPERAQELIDLLYHMFPAIKAYAEEIEKQILSQGYVETYLGRRRRFPLAALQRHRGRAVRQGRNFKIQSTSSDIVISQMLEIDEPLRHDFGGRLLLTVHDSMVLQFPKKYGTQLKEFVLEKAERRVKEKFPWLPVPFTVDIECGPTYGECQPVDKYLAENPFIPKMEGIVEEHEILNELRDSPFEAA